jgi:hypothetical protein
MANFLTSDLWFPVTETRPGIMSATQTTVVQVIYGNGVVALGSANSSIGVIYLDPADAPVSGAGHLRVRAQVITNAVAAACNFTIGLYPITGFGGASGVVPTVTALGAAVASTTISTPSASSQTKQDSAAVAVPTAGWYQLAVVASATMAANSEAMVFAQLQRQFA